MIPANLFKVFLWKNLLFAKFNWLSLLIIFFGCYGILTVYLKSTYQLLTTPNIIYETKDLEILKRDYFPANDEDFIYYTPAALFTDNLMERVRVELQLRGETLKVFGVAAEMLFAMENNCNGNCFAVEFLSFPDEATGKDIKLKYALSSTAIRVSPKKRYVNDEEVNGIKDDDDYIRTGFLTLQNLIDINYIQIQTNADTSNFEFTISSLPSIAIEAMDSQRVTLFGLIFVILLSVLLLSTFLVPLVEEKQDGLKEFLVLATPFNFLNGVTFFLVRFLLYIIFLSAAIIVAFIYNALGIVPVFYIIVLFVLYLLATMSYAYLISVCFNSVFYAKVGGLLLLVIPFIFYLIKGNMSTIATYFLSTKCFMDGMNIFQVFTNKHRHFEFEDVFVNITESSFKIFSIYMLLIVQCLFYCAIYNYLSCVFPGPGGLKKPYLFFLNKSTYLRKQRNQYTTSERSSDVAIIIQDLVKKFYTPTREINIANRLNMEIKNKQITVLLGHNGAGKTTTLNMIMGSVPKDSGKIIVCSERDVSSYRHLIGYCPQHSVFMHYMTCAQHLTFFAQLRGLPKHEAFNLSDNLLTQLNLLDKRNEYGKNLSGGMRRRLSLGIAISGDTKVVVLDEPSSGLDIESRRDLWDVLLELRKTKAVLVTTHHMEEAEVLGDTICILSNGRLERSGSPLELKRKVGSGYILKLRTESNKFNENDTISLIKTTIPSAAIMNIVPPTVLINLPYSNRSDYSNTLQHLEANQNKLGINSIAVSDTSLEDVFLNCAAEVDQVDSPANRNEISLIPYERLEETTVHFSQQFFAVLYKKFLYLCNEWIYTLVMLSLPFLSAGLAIILMHSMSIVGNEDALKLNLQQIKEGIIYINHPANQNSYSISFENILTKAIVTNGIKVKNINVEAENTLAEELIRMQKNDLAYFLQNVIGAISIMPSDSEKIKLDVHFSGNIYHSSTILVNLIDNAILKAEIPSLTSDLNIETTYVPLRRILTDISPTRLEYYAVILPIGLFFYMFFYVSLPFKENKSDFKSLQPMPRSTYWFSVASFDFTLHLLVCSMLFVFQALLMPKELYSINEQLVIIASVLFYGLSYLPILYCLANAFRSISTLSTYLLFMLIVSATLHYNLIFLAIVPLITSGNVQAMKHHETKILFLSLLPDFNLNHQLRIVNENFLIHRRNSILLGGSDNSRFAKTHELLETATFFFNASIIFVIVAAFFVYCWEDKRKRQDLANLFSCYNCRSASKLGSEIPTNTEEETLVRTEKTAVEKIMKEKKENEYPLVVHGLIKLYGRKVAVRGLSFAVKKQECFGLLGVNGAGKTTTFQMLTSNCTISAGCIQITGVDIVKKENQYKYLFGYCPQNDCLNNFMTSYQILKYMAQLRGVRSKDIHSEVMYWLVQLDLLKYKNVCIRYYSGGTKRKLNAAISMIGSPSVVFLDEPTTGVDPVSRRFLWKCVQDFQKRDKTVVLTSHSMDECEQLCNRLAIMTDGQFKCIGYVPDLKKRYGTGFTISAKMRVLNSDENVNEITMQLKHHFSDCILRENHAGMLTYFIKNTNQIAWSSIFKRLEQLMCDCASLIEDYSVNETKLEDIFLKFEKKNNRLTENVEEV